ncbi:MAG: efflux RND transporter periplasmic adaptor subunit [Candidatus Xenobia bacterium]
MRRWLILLLPLLAGCQSSHVPPTAVATPVPVKLAMVEYGDVSRQVELPADVVPYQEALLYARVPGYLKQILVDKGDTVREGQLLATIEAPELTHDVQRTAADQRAARTKLTWGAARLAVAQADRDAARAEVARGLAVEAEARANLQAAKANVSLARVTWQRLKDVFDSDQGLLARQDLDAAQARMQDGEARVTASEDALRAASQAVSAARSKTVASARQIDALAAQYQQAGWQTRSATAAAGRSENVESYTEIRAPFAGIITGRLLDPGTLVQSAESNAQGKTTPVFSLSDFNLVRVTIQVPEADVPDVHPGTPAMVLTRPPIAARVTRTTSALDPASRTMLTEVWVPNRTHRLKPGMYVKVTLDLETHRHVLMVPAASVVSGSVFVARDSHAQKLPIVTGFQSNGWVEVTKGLTGQEALIVSPVDALSPEEPIIVKR